jgi:hypothetical protein
MGLTVTACGCSRKAFDGPTVDAFTGRLTRDGQPVSFAPEENPQLQLFHEKGQSFTIPLHPDGSFKIGWMPIGKYSATLLRDQKPAAGVPKAPPIPNRYNVPDGLTIQDGKTEYTIDLGKNWKP